MSQPHDGRFSFDDRLHRRIRRAFHEELDGGHQSAVLAWASFGATFGVARIITHWIRDGHGPKTGGMSIRGRHFHHYNIGIAMLMGIGALAIRGVRRVERPGTAVAFGVATGLIIDEAALLLDLEDVYWSAPGRLSVDLAVGIFAAGGLGIAGLPFWPSFSRELSHSVRRRSALSSR
ncbi:MAG TPA: hypothetical protein VME70_15385 [Mycobacteriales bacterium]|nr:hypothetical protein [Mycobacteriales bacterium]